MIRIDLRETAEWQAAPCVGRGVRERKANVEIRRVCETCRDMTVEREPDDGSYRVVGLELDGRNHAGAGIDEETQLSVGDVVLTAEPPERGETYERKLEHPRFDTHALANEQGQEGVRELDALPEAELLGLIDVPDDERLLLRGCGATSEERKIG